MILFPAIDVLDNKGVRLLYGDREKVTIYGEPIELAEKWMSQGAKYLHLVDLNGAFGEFDTNKSSIKKVIDMLGIPVQIGGGIRDIDKVKYYLEELGASRVIIGTASVKDPDFMDKICAKYGNKIACGIDAKDGKVAIKGWVDSVDLTPLELALNVKEKGVDTIIYTDISRDGALTGVNVDATKILQDKTNMNIIASGGVKSIDDVKACLENNIYGTILGRALYTNNLDLREASEMVKNAD